ncbi:MAG: hypothetical protein LBT40_04235 [Deltaproteobacteria bacterium]|nr:hypothetical protein [Deltaproteobacteria bacterium]
MKSIMSLLSPKIASLAIALTGAMAVLAISGGTASATPLELEGGAGGFGGTDGVSISGGNPGDGTEGGLGTGTGTVKGGTGANAGGAAGPFAAGTPVLSGNMENDYEYIRITGGKGGDGGSGAGSKAGGGGGDGVSLDPHGQGMPWSKNVTSDGTLVLTGGAGGTGGDSIPGVIGGHAGHGGSVTLGTASTVYTIDLVGKNSGGMTILAGSGGDSGNDANNSTNGNGGSGGSVTIFSGGMSSKTGNIRIDSGKAGKHNTSVTNTPGAAGDVLITIARGKDTGEDAYFTAEDGSLSLDVYDGKAKLTVKGSDGVTAGGGGGEGKISAVGIKVATDAANPGLSSTKVEFTAQGGTAAGDKNNGGAGTIDANGGKLSVASLGNEGMEIAAKGGAGGSGESLGGTGTIKGTGISVTAGTGDVGTVTFLAQGGAGGSAGTGIDGGKASVDALAGSLNVESVATVGSGAIAVTAQGGDSTKGSGGVAEISASGIRVASSGNGTGTVSVSALGGKPSGGNLSGGKATIASVGAIDVLALAGSSHATTLEATGADATGNGDGGDAVVTAQGKDGDITVSTGAGASGTYSASAKAAGGSADKSGTGAGGNARMDASGALSVTSGLVDASAVAAGGAHGTTGSTGGKADISAGSISVVSAGSGKASVEALGGGGAAAKGAGGAAAVSSGNVLVEVQAAGTAADLKVDGAGTYDGTAGANAKLTAADIRIRTLGASNGTASVSVLAGSMLATGSEDGDGGIAEVTAGAIDIASANGIARFDVEGGERGGKAANVSGRAAVSAAGVSVTSAQADALFNIRAGDTVAAQGDGQGASAVLDTLAKNGNISVLSTDVGGAKIVVKASDDNGSSAAKAGQNAEISAHDLTITAEKTGNANVELSAGKGVGTATGGDAIVKLSGNLSMTGADNGHDSSSNLGRASLDATSGTGQTNGTRRLGVGGKISLQSGSGGSAHGGGDVSAVFDIVEAGQISARTGTDSASHDGGDIMFAAAKSLDTASISLENRSATTGNLDFYVGTLKVDGTHDVDITSVGTKASALAVNVLPGGQAGSGVYIQTASFDNDRRLSFRNDKGAVRVDSLSFNGKSGQLYVENSGNLIVKHLDGDNADVTFVVPDGFGDSDTFLKVETASLKGADVTISGDLSGIKTGKDVVFLNVQSGTFADKPNVHVDPYASLTIQYAIDTSSTKDGIEIKSLRKRASPVMKALSEGVVASHAFLNRGSDLAAGEGVSSAVFATADAGFSFFTSLAYGDSRYDTGSHVDVKGLSLILGGAYGADVSFGRFTFGAFFEFGDGTYDTYNDFAGYGRVRGAGDTEYVGGGILARADFAKSESGTTYVEASGRAGRVSVDFMSDNLPSTHRYDLDSTYYGFHMGLGREFYFGSSSLDLYGKWLFTRQGDSDVIVSGRHVHFDDVSSHRLRAGLRLTTEITDMVKPFFGVAYEHELDGKARATVAGFPVDTPELKGGTGIGELGLTITASDRLNLDLGLQGYVGTRRGVSGGFRFTYSF